VQIITKDYQGQAIAYQDDGWFNATQAAAKWGKRPVDWLALQSTKDYIAALKRHNPSMGKTHIARKGGDVRNPDIAQGTWLNPKLAVAFARWLDADFAVWCDAQIDGLIRGKDDWRKLRHASASSFKVANDILKMVREQQSKDTETHHYTNEARLVNWALTGKFEGLERDQLTSTQLDLLAYLQERNAVLIGRGLQYDERKPIIKQYAMDWRMALLTGVAA
jgi:hypothetical protein